MPLMCEPVSPPDRGSGRTELRGCSTVEPMVLTIRSWFESNPASHDHLRPVRIRAGGSFAFIATAWHLKCMGFCRVVSPVCAMIPPSGAATTTGPYSHEADQAIVFQSASGVVSSSPWHVSLCFCVWTTP